MVQLYYYYKTSFMSFLISLKTPKLNQTKLLLKLVGLGIIFVIPDHGTGEYFMTVHLHPPILEFKGEQYLQFDQTIADYLYGESDKIPREQFKELVKNHNFHFQVAALRDNGYWYLDKERWCACKVTEEDLIIENKEQAQEENPNEGK